MAEKILNIIPFSLERIQGYLDIEHEPKETEAGRPPAAWPASGDLRVENLSARYSQVWVFALIYNRNLTTFMADRSSGSSRSFLSHQVWSTHWSWYVYFSTVQKHNLNRT